MSADERVKSFRVPDLGEGLEEVTVTCWNVAVGDDVELNQVLCSVETAKAEVEIPSPYTGRIVERHGAEGDVLKVGAVLVRIDTVPTNGDMPMPDGETAVPTLVGYGADATIDASRRKTGRWPPLRSASWPKNFWLTSTRCSADRAPAG